MRGCFVTGTDTGVGKTVLAAAITAALRADGIRALALKPVITGLADPPDPEWPPDHELLARMCGRTASELALAGYDPPVSPHLAAELSGRPVRREDLLRFVAAASADCQALIVEGVGGLLVPFGAGYDVRGLARDLGLPVVIAARPELGTINHTLLTLEAARAGGLAVAGVVFTPWPRQPSRLERSNRATISRLGDVEVAALERLARPEPALLAAAGRKLPLARWLGLEELAAAA